MAKRTGNTNNKVAVKLLQYFMIVVCVGFIVFLMGRGIVNFLRESPIFKVREVVSQDSLQFIRTRTLDNLIGQSIFDVNLAMVERKLQAEFPQIDHLRIYRQFPNRIYIDAVRRDPFAVIAAQKQNILIDQNATILSFNVPASSRLPVIRGLKDERIPGPGQQLRNPDVMLALRILKAFRGNAKLESMPVVSLDLTKPSEIQGVLANQMHLILSEEKVEHKIAMFGIVISQGKIKPEEINYIDLRFKEPVIGKK